MTNVENQPDSIDVSVNARFASVAERLSAKLAVDDGAHRFTYGELRAKADALAREIDARVEPSRRVVAVFMPTDAAHITAVLAILQSGRIYLSLDPAYPPARLRDMIAAADVALVVTTASLSARADELGARAVLEFDPKKHEETSRGGVPTASGAPTPGPDSFACLYFTSGSTGAPKAVVHTHRNILFDIRRQTRDMRVTAEDRFDLLFSASFSAFLSPVFGALLTGASVHPFNLKTHPPEALRDWLKREAITVSTMSVSSFRNLVSVLEPRRDFPAMRTISVGAEPLALQELHAFRKHFGEQALLQNALATTETRTIAQILYPGTGEIPAQMTVGFPVDGKTLQIRDENGREVVPGDTGEIVIVSEFISPGTWQSLRDIPSAQRGATRMTIHRTGDLARMLPDGQVVHLGRIDTQVKIRGHRIEAGEIEDTLLSHPTVKDAAVFAIGADTGREMLVALVVRRGDKDSCDEETLRRHLLSSMPDFMVPNRIVQTNVLPSTPTGKLDRKQLPSFLREIDVRAQSAIASTPTSPAGAREAHILQIWREVLRRESLGPDDDFFAAGGDSLAATQLAARIVTLAGTPIAPGLLMETPTVRRMVARIDAKQSATSPLTFVHLQRGIERSAPLYLFPPWNTGSVLFRYLSKCENLGAPLRALEGGDRAITSGRADSIEDIAALYVDALLEAHPCEMFSIGGYSMSGFIAWEVAQRLAALGRAPKCVVLLDSPRLYSHCSAEDEAWLARVTSMRGRISTMFNLITRPRGLARETIVTQTFAGSLRRVRHELYDRWFPAPTQGWEADYRRNIDLSVRYRVRPYEGKVAIIRASTQADWFNRVQHDLGWTPFCRGAFSVIDLRGDHHAMFAKPGVRRLNRVLHAAVAEATRANVTPALR